MIQIIRSQERHFADRGWLQTRWHFSFDDYYDPDNVRWGPLRVFNDDVVLPGGGFEMHPHRDMEIITILLDGTLEHRDSLGNRGLLRRGEVQVMSAGRGILHSEFNPSPDEALHLLQLWILPRTRGAEPRWEQKLFPLNERAGRLLPVVVPRETTQPPDALRIDQDAFVYLSNLSSGQELSHHAAESRKAYAFVISGAVTLNDETLEAGDQARISDEEALRIRAERASELILLDLPQ